MNATWIGEFANPWWIDEFYEDFKFELWMLDIPTTNVYINTLHNPNHEKYKLVQNIIITSPKYAYYYALDIIEGPWPMGEPIIATDAKYASYYAEEVIKRPWPEAEPIIATCPVSTFWYAHAVLKKQWPKGESILATDGLWAYLYASNVLKNRFPSAESTIKNSSSKTAYEKRFKITL